MSPELFAGVPVAGLDAALEFYERLAGRPPDFRPNDDEAVWRMAEQAWIYVVRDAERAGRGLLTVLVDDLDAQIAALEDRGIAAEEVPHTPRKVEVTDLEGNLISFAQAA